MPITLATNIDMTNIFMNILDLNLNPDYLQILSGMIIKQNTNKHKNKNKIRKKVWCMLMKIILEVATKVQNLTLKDMDMVLSTIVKEESM